MTVVDRKIYIAIDGKEFKTKKEAEDHEIDLMKPRVYLVIEIANIDERIKFASGCSATALAYMNSLKKKNQDYAEYSYKIKPIILDEEL